MEKAALPPPRRPMLPVRTVQSRPRLFITAALGLAVFFVMPGEWRLVTRLLLTWNLGTLLYIALMLAMMQRATPEQMRARAEIEDESALVILPLTVLAAVASVGAIFAQLAFVKDLQGDTKALHIALAALTILTAWCLIQMMFALHYAHEFYIERKSVKPRDPEQRGGLRFPATALPDYSDFLYFSFVIGCAAATADIDICSNPMRRIALAQGIIAYFFNAAILALTINIAAGLV